MATIDLDNLQATDITPTLNALHRFFMAHGITVVTDNLFLKPEQLLLDEPMSKHTTFEIGGPADCLIFPASIPRLLNLSKFLRHW